METALITGCLQLATDGKNIQQVQTAILGDSYITIWKLVVRIKISGRRDLWKNIIYETCICGKCQMQEVLDCPHLSIKEPQSIASMKTLIMRQETQENFLPN